MKFSSVCKVAHKFKAQLKKDPLGPSVEWFKNLHVPTCKLCTRRAPAPALKPKVTKKGDRYTVSSFSDPKKVYVVTKKGARYACSCPAWIYSKDRGNCKHIDKIKKAA